MIGDSNDKTNFPRIILLTDIQVSRIRKAFASNLSPNIELSEIQLFKVVQSGVFLSKFIGPLLKTGSPLMKNLLKPLAKGIFIPIGLKAAASAADRNIQKNYRIGDNNINNLKWRNGRYNENSKISQRIWFNDKMY